MSGFDDHLGLQTADLSKARALVFCGPSGAGKSSYIDWLAASHWDFAGRSIMRVDQGRPLAWPVRPELVGELIIVDELLTLGDLRRFAALVFAGHCVLAASHLPPALHRIGAPFGVRTFDLGSGTAKLQRYLGGSGWSYSQAGLAHFHRRFGASYTALDCVLSEWGDGARDFDVALAHFERYCTVRVERRLEAGCSN